MEMELHYIPHKKGEYHVYQNHRLKNVDSVEKVDGHRDPPRSSIVKLTSIRFLLS
jgi:hypothetical protein